MDLKRRNSQGEVGGVLVVNEHLLVKWPGLRLLNKAQQRAAVGWKWSFLVYFVGRNNIGTSMG